MKNELSSVDVRVLVRELRQLLVGSRVDKVYHVGERELVMKVYGRGSIDLVAAPNFICVTKYKRPSPRTPSSFAMQLRKHLKGAYIKEVEQHGFDRIIEFHLDNHTIIFELFSKGNVILCSKDMLIIGLLEWQRWRDRMLGVGKKYEYPPSGINPFEVDEDTFRQVMSDSQRGLASTLATKFGLGGYYAELICAKIGIDPKARYCDVDSTALWRVFSGFLGEVDGKVEAHISSDNVTPFGGEGEKYATFNDAVDEYFSVRESKQQMETAETQVAGKKKKLMDILFKQEHALKQNKVEAVEYKNRGDLLYQRMNEIDQVVAQIREGKRKGLSDRQLMEELRDCGFVKDFSGYTLTLEL